ncbi:MAG: SDR family oxidoreductase [Anaerolineales bacterium]|nr:SDR family oxidoreductase [Anaerolineales bacterium]MCB8953642.1 SDR family oxidoreductase [Ardenticatenales bacterium]
MYNLTGKVALITGAGRRSGIGAAIARRLAAEGAHVVVSDICAAPSALPHGGNAQWEELVAVAAEIAGMGVDSLPLRADVTQSANIQEMVATVQSQFGRLDILVNNAGATIGPAPVLQMTEEAWRKTLEINATGTFLCCKVALPLMLAGGQGGRIINISSIAALRPRPFLSAYAGSKAAINALTQSLAQEVGEFGITVNAILPGDIDTGMKQWGMQLEAMVLGRTAEDVAADLTARIPLRRMGVPADVARLVAFLASDEAAFITGQTYNLTGGRELA